MSVRRTRKDDGSQWTVADSRSVYGIRHWGAGYFAINEAGRVEVRPNGPGSSPIDLYEQVDALRKSGLSLPLLVRFPDILQDRVRQLTGAFDENIARLEYQSKYTALYPIKVNQQEAVVENIIATQNVSIGLEAGSKPELMAVLALAPKGGTIVCNGYKDREFIRLALMGQKLGHNVFIVIEKESEVELVIEEAAELLPTQPNAVTLIANRDAEFQTADVLLTATLRMRPDRIILGEVRGKEAMTFLEAINTGHGGSMTTLHAETPQLAVQRLAIAALKTEIPMTYADMIQYIENSIDVIIQAGRHDGKRGITEFYLPGTTEIGAYP